MRGAIGFVVICVGLVLVGSGKSAAAENELKLYVAKNGNDDWSGRLADPRGDDGPFATLERARDEIRRVKKAGKLPEDGVTVYVMAGEYELAQPFKLTAEDSGAGKCRITYRAQRGAEVRLSAGRLVTNWERVHDKWALSRLPAEAVPHVYQADLKALGITDYGSPGGGGLELFFNEQPMTLARWPNEGFVRIKDVLGIKPRNVRGTKGDSVGKFVYEGDRPSRWVGEKDLWLHGYWFWDWSDQRQKVVSIDTERHIIELARPYHHYGYRKGQWYYAYNALCELDRPGEWYLDRETGILYFWPPGDIRKGRVMVSVLPSVVEMENVQDVTLRGFVIEGCRGTAIMVKNGRGVRIVGCVIRNTGGNAISLSGRACAVIGCDMYNLGAGGVSLSGGDRKTLSPAGNYAENNHIHHYGRIKRMYTPAIGLYGVGNRASHNMVHDAPHQAIAFGGNDHLIEYNEIYRVGMESNDAGAIYAGRDWTQRGTVIRYNYFRDITGFRGRGCVGVYLDDMFCGTTIFGNVFYNVTRAAFIGGGRDNVIENNIFVDCRPAVHLDARALGWARGAVNGVMKQRLFAMPYKSPLWAKRYPKLVNIWEDEPAVPKGNVIARNICWGGRWAEWDRRVLKYQTIKDNLVGVDPHFVDLEHGNFQLRDDSPAWKIGFKRIPFEKIGLYRDTRRATWPVPREQVRVPKVERAPKKPAERGPAPVCKVPKVDRAPKVDGKIEPREWLGADRKKALPIAEGIKGEKVEPPSRAWVVRTERHLFVAVENDLAGEGAVSGGHKWGADDAVEIALQSRPGERGSCIIVLRGYTDGHWESSAEAGAPREAVERAARWVKYAARVEGKRWTCEWRISFAAVGLDPAKHRRVPFNISVRKTRPKPQWLMWRGTGGYTWAVDHAGVIEIGP